MKLAEVIAIPTKRVFPQATLLAKIREEPWCTISEWLVGYATACMTRKTCHDNTQHGFNPSRHRICG